MDNNDYIDTLKQFIEKHPILKEGVGAILLGGSLCTGCITNPHDIDLTMLLDIPAKDKETKTKFIVRRAAFKDKRLDINGKGLNIDLHYIPCDISHWEEITDIKFWILHKNILLWKKRGFKIENSVLNQFNTNFLHDHKKQLVKICRGWLNEERAEDKSNFKSLYYIYAFCVILDKNEIKFSSQEKERLNKLHDCLLTSDERNPIINWCDNIVKKYSD